MKRQEVIEDIEKLDKLMEEFKPSDTNFGLEEWLKKVSIFLGEPVEEICDDHFYNGNALNFLKKYLKKRFNIT